MCDLISNRADYHSSLSYNLLIQQVTESTIVLNATDDWQQVANSKFLDKILFLRTNFFRTIFLELFFYNFFFRTKFLRTIFEMFFSLNWTRLNRKLLDN